MLLCSSANLNMTWCVSPEYGRKVQLTNPQIACLELSYDQYLFDDINYPLNPILCLTGSRQHCTLKAQLILIHFYFYFYQFQINRARFSLIFPTDVQFFTQIAVLCFLEPFSSQLLYLNPQIWTECSAASCPPFFNSSKSIDLND